jgi:phage shock protein A
MLKLLRRAWKYMIAALTGKLDEISDPKVQIEQAIDEAKRQHELLSQQAAAVLGNQRQLEMRLSRQIDEVERLKGSARQALILSEEARKAGDSQRQASYEQAAQAFAARLVSAEASAKDMKALHDQSLQASEQAKRAVEQNAFLLQKRLAERSQLLSQLDQAKMQERMNDALRSVSELTAPGDVPTLAEVRDKIEARYARAMGEAEIASSSVESRMLEVEKATIDAEGAQRLDEIRASLGLPAESASAALAGDPSGAEPAVPAAPSGSDRPEGAGG